MAIKIEDVVAISGGYLKQPVYIKNEHIERVQGDDDEELVFVSLAAIAPHTIRLVCGQVASCEGKRRPLTNTNVLELIKQARNEAVESKVEEMKLQEAAREAEHFREQNAGKKLFELDDPPIIDRRHKKRKPIDMTALPQWVLVKAPGISGEENDEAHQMRVMIPREPRLPLYVELTADNITHLHRIAVHDAATGEIKRAHMRTSHTPIGMTGLSRIYTGKHQGKYKFQAVDGLKRRATTFPAANDDAAKMFASSITDVSPSHSPSILPDEPHQSPESADELDEESVDDGK